MKASQNFYKNFNYKNHDSTTITCLQWIFFILWSDPSFKSNCRQWGGKLLNLSLFTEVEK